MVKLVPAEILLEARDQKRAAAVEKLAKKAENLAKEREKKQEQMEKGRVSPGEIFRGEGQPYGSWTAEGIPLTKLDGQELSKSESKKVRKLWEEQGKRHELYLQWMRDSQ